MIELAQHIETLLLENDCVIVPGFGGFVAHYSPATRVKEENIFLPPTRTIGFNPQLKLNDGVLVQSYMSAYDTSFADASRIVEKEVNEFIGLLHEEGKAHLDNIGEIHYNIYGNYEFVPYDYKITTPSLYGLDSFEMHELSVLQQKEKVWIPAHPEKEKKTFEISINRAYLRNAAAMIAAIVLFFAFSTPVENTDVQKNNYAQLLPSELFEQIEKQSVVVTPVYVKSDAMQQAKKLSATASTSSSTKTSSTKKNTADKTSKPIAVREVKVAKQETAATAPAVKSPESANHPFHIIVAGGISLKDAEAIATQLKSKGFANAKALNMDGKVRVSINSFDNRNEATKQLLELRKNETYKNAWLLAKLKSLFKSMKRILCPKCENYLFFDETKYSEGQSLVFEWEHCGKQFSIRLGKSKVKALRKEENLEEEAESHKEEFGYITVIENVFGYKQILPLQEGDNVIGRRCVGTSINTPIESGDMSMDRRHCIINIKRNKQGKLVYTLRDAPSLTGTFLMNEILGDKDRVRIEDGAIVTIGATTFILHAAE